MVLAIMVMRKRQVRESVVRWRKVSSSVRSSVSISRVAPISFDLTEIVTSHYFQGNHHLIDCNVQGAYSILDSYGAHFTLTMT